MYAYGDQSPYKKIANFLSSFRNLALQSSDQNLGVQCNTHYVWKPLGLLIIYFLLAVHLCIWLGTIIIISSNYLVTGSLGRDQKVILWRYERWFHLNSLVPISTYAQSRHMKKRKRSLPSVTCNWTFYVIGFGQLCMSDPGNIILHLLWIVTVKTSF